MRCLVSGREGNVEGDDVGLREEPVERELLVRARPAGVDDAHAERLREPGDLPADTAEAHDPERLPGETLAQHERRRERPLVSPADEPVPLHHAPEQGEHERDRQLGGRLGEHIGGIGDHDAPPRCFGQVDAVIPDSEVRDDAEAWTGGVEEPGIDDVGRDRDEAGRAGDLVREREGRLEAREHRVGHAPREEDLRLHVSRTVMARSRG